MIISALIVKQALTLADTNTHANGDLLINDKCTSVVSCYFACFNVQRDMMQTAGQEKKWVPGAQHTSCTIEMTNTQKRVDVAVVDEVQVSQDIGKSRLVVDVRSPKMHASLHGLDEAHS